MTRLLHSLTSLTSLCLITLVIGCGGSSTKKTTKCDGGACSDAKGDAVRLDGKLDGKAPDTLATTPDGGTTDLVVVPPDTLPGTPDTLPTDTVVATPDTLIVTPDVASDRVDTAVDTVVVPTDVLPSDVRPADVTPDRADTTVLTDTRPDTTTIPVEAGPDTPVTPPDAGTDTPIVVTTDAGADVSDDATEEEVAVPVDATVDAAVVETGEAGCLGALCDDFQADNPDAGLPGALTVVGTGAGDTWAIVADSTNMVLQQTDDSVASTYVVAGSSSWTDQTIEVDAEFLSVSDPASQIRICGRFDATSLTGYCLYVTSGTTSGTMTLYKRTGGGVPQLAQTIELAIPMTSWHSYKLVIHNASATSVTISAYLDSATTPTVTAVDTGTIIAAGAVGLGTSGASANFDTLFVTTP
jgi:hypothetical protein